MTSFSVKKPFTVFVAVVAVLVFGVMSYVKMTPDLMPNMDYPYVVVVTTYPGAAPEEVEAVVTKPMEQSMATLNDIKTVTSTSAENYSMLVLEFEQDTNMDSAVVDILQKTQLLAGADANADALCRKQNCRVCPAPCARGDCGGTDGQCRRRI